MTALVPSTPTAMPRKSASVPIVTASDGRPTYAIRKPLSAPQASPASMATTAASGTATPWSTSTPSSTLLRPRTLATERSISPVTMINVIGSAISRIGAMSRNR